MAPFDEVGVLTFRAALTVGPELQLGQTNSRCAARVQELYKRGQETQRDTERHRETHYVM